MAKRNDEELTRKIIELDQQMERLTGILEMMVDKIDRIEKTTVQIQDEMQEEIDELTGNKNGEQKR